MATQTIKRPEEGEGIIVKKMVVSPEPASSQNDEPVVMGAELCLEFLRQTKAIDEIGLKSYGVFSASRGDGRRILRAGIP